MSLVILHNLHVMKNVILRDYLITLHAIRNQTIADVNMIMEIVAIQILGIVLNVVVMHVIVKIQWFAINFHFYVVVQLHLDHQQDRQQGRHQGRQQGRQQGHVMVHVKMMVIKKMDIVMMETTIVDVTMMVVIVVVQMLIRITALIANANNKSLFNCMY